MNSFRLSNQIRPKLLLVIDQILLTKLLFSILFFIGYALISIPGIVQVNNLVPIITVGPSSFERNSNVESVEHEGLLQEEGNSILTLNQNNSSEIISCSNIDCCSNNIQYVSSSEHKKSKCQPTECSIVSCCSECPLIAQNTNEN